MLLVDDLDGVVDPGHLLQHVVVVAGGEVPTGVRRRVVGSILKRRRRLRFSSEDVLYKDLLDRLLSYEIMPDPFDRSQPVTLGPKSTKIFEVPVSGNNLHINPCKCRLYKIGGN
jgi:hypothetical protein